MCLGGILLRLDHDPAGIAGQRAEYSRVIDAAIARHREHACNHGVEEAEALRFRRRHHARPYILGVHMADA